MCESSPQSPNPPGAKHCLTSVDFKASAKRQTRAIDVCSVSPVLNGDKVPALFSRLTTYVPSHHFSPPTSRGQKSKNTQHSEDNKQDICSFYCPTSIRLIGRTEARNQWFGFIAEKRKRASKHPGCSVFLEQMVVLSQQGFWLIGLYHSSCQREISP